MKITQALLDKLTEQAKASLRLRMNYDLRNSDADQSQRMLNAIEPGSPLPIHRHQNTSETVVCLRGRLIWEYYDELERRCTETIELSPNGQVVKKIKGRFFDPFCNNIIRDKSRYNHICLDRRERNLVRVSTM